MIAPVVGVIVVRRPTICPVHVIAPCVEVIVVFRPTDCPVHVIAPGVSTTIVVPPAATTVGIHWVDRDRNGGRKTGMDYVTVPVNRPDAPVVIANELPVVMVCAPQSM